MTNNKPYLPEGEKYNVVCYNKNTKLNTFVIPNEIELERYNNIEDESYFGEFKITYISSIIDYSENELLLVGSFNRVKLLGETEYTNSQFMLIHNINDGTFYLPQIPGTANKIIQSNIDLQNYNDATSYVNSLFDRDNNIMYFTVQQFILKNVDDFETTTIRKFNINMNNNYYYNLNIQSEYYFNFILYNSKVYTYYQKILYKISYDGNNTFTINNFEADNYINSINVLGKNIVLNTYLNINTNICGQFFDGEIFSPLPNRGISGGWSAQIYGILGNNEILFLPTYFRNDLITLDNTKNFGLFGVLLKYDDETDTYYYESSNCTRPYFEHPYSAFTFNVFINDKFLGFDGDQYTQTANTRLTEVIDADVLDIVHNGTLIKKLLDKGLSINLLYTTEDNEWMIITNILDTLIQD